MGYTLYIEVGIRYCLYIILFKYIRHYHIIPLLNIDRLDVLYHIVIQAQLFVLFIEDSFLIYLIIYLNI